MTKSEGVIQVFTEFQASTVTCGSKNGLKSMRAGAKCDSDTDCLSNIDGIYAPCECSYNGQKVCGILFENAEYSDYV